MNLHATCWRMKTNWKVTCFSAYVQCREFPFKEKSASSLQFTIRKSEQIKGKYVQRKTLWLSLKFVVFCMNTCIFFPHMDRILFLQKTWVEKIVVATNIWIEFLFFQEYFSSLNLFTYLSYMWEIHHSLKKEEVTWD